MRRSTLALALLLTMAIFPNFVQADEIAPLFPITSPSANLAAGATQDCRGDLLSMENSAAGVAVLAPELRQSVQYCGVCSENPCQGAERYTICGYDYNAGRYKRCDYYLGGTCSEDEQIICRCYSEDIP